jgi:hypothetical protein
MIQISYVGTCDIEQIENDANFEKLQNQVIKDLTYWLDNSFYNIGEAQYSENSELPKGKVMFHFTITLTPQVEAGNDHKHLPPPKQA